MRAYRCGSGHTKKRGGHEHKSPVRAEEGRKEESRELIGRQLRSGRMDERREQDTDGHLNRAG